MEASHWLCALSQLINDTGKLFHTSIILTVKKNFLTSKFTCGLYWLNFVTNIPNPNEKYVLSNSESVQCNFFIFDHVTSIQFKICCCVHNFTEIGWFFAEIWRYIDFQNDGRFFVSHSSLLVVVFFFLCGCCSIEQRLNLNIIPLNTAQMANKWNDE